MSGSGTKFLASTLLALNLLPGALGGPKASADPNAPQTSRFVNNRAGQGDQDPPQDQFPPSTAAADQSSSRSDKRDTEIAADLRRRSANEALLEAAQDDFVRAAKGAEDGYSKDLKKKEKQLSKYLHKNVSDRPQAVIIDPNKFDTGLALGFSPEGTTERLLAAKRVELGDDEVKDIANSMQSDDLSKVAAQNGHTQDPSAHYDPYKTTPQACVIVPDSSYASEFPIKNLSYQERHDFINFHEGWHCKDDRLHFDDLSKDILSGLDASKPENSIGNKDQMEAFCRLNRAESMSDVGALGDMIRNGHSVDIIGKVQLERYGSPEDYTHWTGQSLEGLKQKINEMGIDNFRRLSDKDAKKLYEDVINKNTFTPDVAETIFAYRRTSSDEDRAALRDWKESFALLDSLKKAGAVIHDGADIKALDDQIAATSDAREKTALTGLRDQINSIGVDRFRKLDVDDAQKMADALHATGATGSDIGEIAAGYWISSPDERKKMDLNATEFAAVVPKALAMMKPYGEPPDDAQKAAMKNNVTMPQPLSPAEADILRQAGQWDAAKLLQDRAFAKDGKITPATLIHAYGRMQDELRNDLKKHPEDPLLRAKTSKLQQSFISTVHDLDYVQANADRGVDIYKKEPVLAKFQDDSQNSGTPSKETAPEPPKQDQPAAPGVPIARRAPVPTV